VALQALADEIGLRISVCHLPPGTSKWNKIEHRLFAHISMNWRGRPLISHDVIVDLIGATTTRSGLTVQAMRDTGSYPTKIKVSDEELDAVQLERQDFHGEWNYTISPTTVPRLQSTAGVAHFFRAQRGATFASSALMDPMTAAFIVALERFARTQNIPLFTFAKGQRKDEVAAAHLAQFDAEEGVLFIGKAQEKTAVVRTQKRRNPDTGQSYPWLVRSTAMVNHYYIYGVDRDFGPFFLKFCSYFPYNAKLCVNGHEYLKRQLAREGIAYDALDNGLLSCANPARMQEICDGLTAPLINGLLRKWLARLPHPFTPADRDAGYRYDVSILQAEFALTQVLDRPVTGRVLFEEVIRENVDLGRPDHVQLIFDRRVTKRTPGRFRTRVITQGVTPSLYADDTHSRIKQYHKGCRLRTRTGQ